MRAWKKAAPLYHESGVRALLPLPVTGLGLGLAARFGMLLLSLACLLTGTLALRQMPPHPTNCVGRRVALPVPGLALATKGRR